MTLRARAVIEDARDLHPAFDDNSNPDGVLVRALNRLQMELVASALTRYPSYYGADQDIDHADFDFEAGQALTSPFFIQDLTHFSGGIESPMPIIPFEHRFDNNQPYLRAWIKGLRLYLAPPASIWSDIQTVRIRYASTIPQVTKLDQDLVIQDEARSALVLGLAEVMAARGTQRKDIDPPRTDYFGAKAMAEREKWLTDLWLLRSVEVRFIRDVGP